MYHVTICKDAVIGDRVFIGPNTSFFNDKYPPTKISQPPIIGNDVVIGGGCNIGPGVVVRDRGVVGMGANLTSNVPSEVVVITENRHQLIMTRKEYDKRQRKNIEENT